MPAIHIDNLWFRYPSPLLDGEPVNALCGINLDVQTSEFLAVMGPVGAGKSSLCLALSGAIPHAVEGQMEGTVTIWGQDTRHVPIGDLCTQVGFCFEDAETQLFNATVADEVAFGLEAAGLPATEIERRIDQALALVGLDGTRNRIPHSLSGGEQKRLAMACALAIQPTVLVLDDPTAGLDARGRHEVLASVERLREQNTRTTIVMATQDAEAAATFADRIAVLENGQLVALSSPAELFSQPQRLAAWGIAAPQLARLAVRCDLPVALSVDDALKQWQGTSVLRHPSLETRNPQPTPAQTIIQVMDVAYEYVNADQSALRDVTLDIHEGEWLAVIGINGSGKSTLIKHLNGLLRPSQGVVQVRGQDTQTQQVGALAHTVGYVAQNPDHSIFCATVRDEVAYGPKQLDLSGTKLETRVRETLELFDLTALADYPPATLGYGLRRQVALASILAMHTPVLVLDEPTTGQDERITRRLMDILSHRHSAGATIVMVTHDLALVEQYAQRVVALHDGTVAAQGPVRDVLSNAVLLRSIGLRPLPVTALAEALGWAPPLPVSELDWGQRD
jgi:energy-coupling factor transporter ATP-binding protein EcfA2